MDELGFQKYSDEWPERAGVFSLAHLAPGPSGPSDHLTFQGQLHALGDVDGDGLDDLSWRYSAEYLGLEDDWFVWLSDGQLDGHALSPNADSVGFAGAEQGWPLGLFGGDMNEDGRSEVWISQTVGDDNCARFAASTMLATPDFHAEDTPGWCYGRSEYSSRSLSEAGDTDGDGLSDLVYSGTCAGSPCAGVVPAADITATDEAARLNDGRSTARCEGDGVPTLSAAGDANLDGADDIVLRCTEGNDPPTSFVIVGGGTTAEAFHAADGWWTLDSTGLGGLDDDPRAGVIDGVPFLAVNFDDSYSPVPERNGQSVNTAFSTLSEPGSHTPEDAVWVVQMEESRGGAPPISVPTTPGMEWKTCYSMTRACVMTRRWVIR